MKVEEIVEEMERFWSEVLQNLKEVVEKEESEVADQPAGSSALP